MNLEKNEEEEEFVFDLWDGEENPIRACISFIEEMKKGFKKDDTPLLTSEDEKSFKISDERIFRIPPCGEKRTIGFVDGGNAPLIKSADFTISLNRIASVLFKDKQIIPPKKTPEFIEFFSGTVLTTKDDGSLQFLIRTFSRNRDYSEYLPPKDISIDLKEQIKERRGRIPPIERYAALARRFTEWSYAKKLVQEELSSKDIFVKDGSLQTGFEDEILLARDLYTTGVEKNVYITGLSKTCRLFTMNGDSLISIINHIGKEKYPHEQWYYHPIYKITKADNQADLYFLKLHKEASHPFRFDIYIKQSEKLDKNEIETIISNLAHNSNDLSFPGYPYGLIKADQMSRIAYKELDSQKIMMISEFDQNIYNNFIKPRLDSVNAHDLINEIRR